MNWKHLLAYVATASIVVGCGGESDSKAPEINIDIEVTEVVGPETPEDNITNTSLPVVETFDTASDAPSFFSDSYKALSSDSASAAEDAFYYSTAGVFQDDGSPDPNPSTWITGDSDPGLRLGDSRFTIGQVVSVFADPEATDPRKNSTPGEVPDDAIGSWGELDLSTSYTVSFCVVDRSEEGNFYIYVDNNSTSSGNSILGSSSIAVNVGQNTMTAGTRASFDIDVGTVTSFIQLRADKPGWVVMDDLVIENAANPAAAQPDCSAKTTTYGTSPDGGTPPPSTTVGVPFAGLPYNVDFSLDKDSFFGDGDEDFVSISDDDTNPFYKVTGGNSAITLAGGSLTMANARFTMGSVDNTTDTNATDQPNGNIDLSRPYRLTIVLSEFTGTGAFHVYVDNNTSSSGNSIHGSSSKILQLAADDASITGFPHTITLEPTDIGTATSFIQIRADSGVQTLVIDRITLEYLPPNDALLYEDFGAADATEFFSTAYKTLEGDPTSPFYVATGNGSSITVDGSAGTISYPTARFTIGDTATGSTADGVDPAGTLDLTNGFRISFTVQDFTSIDAASPAKMQVYVNNNTSSSNSSKHGGDSKITEIADGTITSFPYFYSFTSTPSDGLGGPSSFFQLRSDSKTATLTISDLLVTTPLVYENFSAADATEFFSASYKALSTDNTAPLYNATGNSSSIVVDPIEGTISYPTARFTIGDTGVATADGMAPAGTLDLSRPYTISFTIVDFTSLDSASPAKMQVYIDNNTSSSSSSIHGGDSKFLEIADGDGTITSFPHTVSISPDIGTATSLVQLRSDSKTATLVIKDLMIIYN